MLSKVYGANVGFSLIILLTKIPPEFFEKNHIVYTPFDEANTIYLVYKGEVRKNNKDKLIDTFGIGNSFGELALLGELNDDDELPFD